MHVARGAGGGLSDHFQVVAKVNGQGIGFGRRKEQVQCREVIKVKLLISTRKREGE